MVVIKRKVVKHGPSTMIISLPNEWVKEQGIEKGMELNVDQKDNNLIISTTSTKGTKEIEVDISGMTRDLIVFYLRTIYRRGYDQVRLTFKEPKCTNYREKRNDLTISIIHGEVDNLIGYEIIEQKERSCTITDVSEDSGKNFENIIRKVFLIIDQTFQDIITAVKNKDDVLLQTVSHKHDTISKFLNYSMRVLNKGIHSINAPQDMYNILTNLYQIANIMKYSSKDVLEKDIIFSQIDIGAFSLIGQYIKLFEKFFYNFKKENASELIKTRFEFLTELQSISKSKQEKSLRIVCNLGRIVEILDSLIPSKISLEI